MPSGIRVIRVIRVICLTGFMVVLASATTFAQRPEPVHPRAEHPEFDQSGDQPPFFKDVFSVLVGERPDVIGAPSRVVTPEGGPASDSDDSGSGAGGEYAWSKIISATTIEDEVKAIKLQVDQDVTTPSQFRSGGYQECRRHFSVIAMLLHIIHQYDGDVRFQEGAAAARDVFSRTAANAKVGTTQVYNEAKLRKQDLQDLVGGARLQGPAGGEDVVWGQIVDRSPLMQRLEAAQPQRLRPLTGNEGSFKENKAKIIHEAEMVAAMADVLSQEGMEDADDETYLEYADRMKQAALEVVSSAKLDNFSAVSKNVGEISKACTECHEGYR